MNPLLKRAAATAVLSLVGPTLAQALVLPPPGFPYSNTYTDFVSYSLPIVNYFTQGDGTVTTASPGPYGNTVQPGEPGFVKSAPGELGKDGEYIVIATGTNNQGVNDNGDVSSLIDDAYETPDGGQDGTLSFSTVTSSVFPVGVSDPNSDGIGGTADDFVGDFEDSWDINVGALNDFLGGDDMVVFFNHNELNAGNDTGGAQALFAWAKVWFTDLNGNQYDIDGDNNINNDMDDFLWLSDGGKNQDPGPIIGGDWVFAAGEVCLDPDDIFNPDIGCVSDPDNDDIEFDHNLGADNAAYAVVSDQLNTILGLLDGNWILHVDLRMISEDNGYEQAFIAAVESPTTPEPDPVPEPNSLAMLGLGILGLLLARRRLLIT